MVGRNSRFEHLTEAQQEELGGVEYRALGLLLKIVPIYWLGFQLIGVLLIAPWLAISHKYAATFDSAGVNTTWYSFFQVSGWLPCLPSICLIRTPDFERLHQLRHVVSSLGRLHS